MSNINKYVLKGDNLSFNQKRFYFVDNYSNTINLYLLGSWFKVFNNDAKIINNIMDYKLFEDHYSPYLNNICCGFPETSLGKVEYYLEKYNINYNIINIEKNEYELHDYEDKNCYLDYLNTDSFEKVIPINEHSDVISGGKSVEIGDTVIIMNLKNGNKDEYTIKKAYYEAKPVGINKGPFSFGTIKYKDELINHSDVEKGEILSDAPLAQILLGLSEGDVFITKDEEVEDCEYQVITIQKNEEEY